MTLSWLQQLVGHIVVLSATTAGVASSFDLSKSPLQPYGQSITLPFPNDETILGIGGLAYDDENDIWTAPAENIRGLDVDHEYPIASVPRFYHMKLDFEKGEVDFLSQTDESHNEDGNAILVEPSDGLKLEDIALVPNRNLNVEGSSKGFAREFWLVSEANSELVKTSQFLSKDFGPPDLNTYDPNTFDTSRLIRVHGGTGQILETADIPAFAQWKPQDHNWDAMKCTGDRPFQGFHAVCIAPSPLPSASAPEVDNDSVKMIVAVQAAFYQDGPTPTEFEGSATRILVFNLNFSQDNDSSKNSGANPSVTNTASYEKSYRYDTSQLTIKTFQKGARHFNALMGVLALNETSLLVAECEDFFGFGLFGGQKIVNRIFHVNLEDAATVDHCTSLLDCDVPTSSKRLVWERDEKDQLDGLGWGPTVTVTKEDGSSHSLPTVALTYENDDNIGVRFELFTLDQDYLWSGEGSELWKLPQNKYDILTTRKVAFFVSVGVVLVLALIQLVWVERMNRTPPSDSRSAPESSLVASQLQKPTFTQRRFKYSYYVMGSCMLNSFLVGGVTFGFPGMALMLRKEGVYAEGCACGTFCAGEKEQLALVSTLGFAVAIGSRLFIGRFLDVQGPKATAVLCGLICLSGFGILAATPAESLSDTFLYSWLLLSLGGSGLHIAGFHATNLFRGSAKKVASAGISACFGASSGVFSIMQMFNQYAGVSLQAMATGYSVIVSLVVVNNFFVQPWQKVQPGIPLKPDFEVWQKRWWRKDIKKKPMLSSALQEMVKFEMWGETMFYSFSLLLLTYFLSTSTQLLYEKGDIPFTTNPNDWTDYMFSRLAGWFNSLGFIWFPIVQLVMTSLQWPLCYLILSVINIAVVIIIMINVLEVQVLGFVLLSMARLMLFSFHHAYILDKFGIEHFGTLNGISSFIAAIIGLLGYPLQLFALYTSYTVSFIPIGGAILLCTAFPLILRKRRVLNWAESYSIDPTIIKRPENIKELKSLVTKDDTKIRCVGAMHSCAPLVECEGMVISLEKMNKIIEVDTERSIAVVEAGVRIYELCAALKPYGLALGTLGTIDWQTIAGAVMTGTHGGSLTTPSLHAFIESYTLMKADGTFTTVSRENDPYQFSAMAPSLGLFGIVTEVEVRCVPFQYLEARMVSMSFDDMIPKFQDIMRTNKYARVVVYPSIRKATVWTANPVQKGEAVARGALKSTGYINFRDENEKANLEQFLLLCKKGSHKRADEILHKVLESQLTRLAHYEGQYNHVLCKERNNGIPHADIEFGFDFNSAPDVLRTVQSYCDLKRVPYYNFEIRTTKSDDAMLSCCHNRDTMYIDFQAKSNVSHEFFRDMEDLLQPFGYRKHWAKGLGHSQPEYLLKQFPKLVDFMELMEKYDPEGKFRNEHVEVWFEKTMKATLDLEDGTILSKSELIKDQTEQSTSSNDQIEEEFIDNI